MRQIIWEPPAAREFDRLLVRVQESIHVALACLAAYGQGDVKAMEGTQHPEYRLRVGKCRVRFALPKGTQDLLVLHVRPRGSAYRDV